MASVKWTMCASKLQERNCQSGNETTAHRGFSDQRKQPKEPPEYIVFLGKSLGLGISLGVALGKGLGHLQEVSV